MLVVLLSLLTFSVFDCPTGNTSKLSAVLCVQHCCCYTGFNLPLVLYYVQPRAIQPIKDVHMEGEGKAGQKYTTVDSGRGSVQFSDF